MTSLIVEGVWEWQVFHHGLHVQDLVLLKALLFLPISPLPLLQFPLGETVESLKCHYTLRHRSQQEYCWGLQYTHISTWAYSSWKCHNLVRLPNDHYCGKWWQGGSLQPTRTGGGVRKVIPWAHARRICVILKGHSFIFFIQDDALFGIEWVSRLGH